MSSPSNRPAIISEVGLRDGLQSLSMTLPDRKSVV